MSRISNTGHFVTYGSGADGTWEHGLWSVLEEARLADIRYKEPAYTRGIAEDTNRGRHVLLVEENNLGVVDALGHDGSVEHLGSLGFVVKRDQDGKRLTHFDLDPQNGAWIGVVADGDVFVVEVGDHALSSPRRLGRVGAHRR